MRDKAKILMVRVDERLLHGQGQIWIKHLGANSVIVADDEVVNDQIQQSLMKTVIPKEIAVSFYGVNRLIEIFPKANPKQEFFIVVKSPENALRLVEGGLEISEVNLGNIHNAEGKEMVTRSIYLGKNDKEALRRMRDEFNVKFNTKTTPTGGDGAIEVNINNYI